MIYVATKCPAAFPAVDRLASFARLEEVVPDLGATFRRHVEATGCDVRALVDVRGARTDTGIGFLFAFPEMVVLTWEVVS